MRGAIAPVRAVHFLFNISRLVEYKRGKENHFSTQPMMILIKLNTMRMLPASPARMAALCAAQSTRRGLRHLCVDHSVLTIIR